MSMEARPAMEERKATVVIVRLGIRHSMRVECLQTCDVRMLESRINKSHCHIRHCGLRASENIARPFFIEWPNSNLPIPSGFFFFHRGLPFSSVVIHTSYTGVYMSRHICIHLYTHCFDARVINSESCISKAVCVKTHLQHCRRGSSRTIAAHAETHQAAHQRRTHGDRSFAPC